MTPQFPPIENTIPSYVSLAPKVVYSFITPKMRSRTFTFTESKDGASLFGDH